MRNPHLLADNWNKTVNSTKPDPLPVSVPANKKLKRKSREPKRLYHSSTEPEVLKTFPPDEDSAGEMGIHEEPYNISRLAAFQRHLVMPQESGTTGITPGLPGGRPTLMPHIGQSTAIDMRITSNVPGIAAKLAQLPNPQLPNTQASHRPSPLSQPQPQSESHKLGLHSAFPSLATSTTSHDHPSLHHLHPYPQDASLSARLGVSQVRGERAGASQTVYSGHTAEQQAESPKESPRKRAVGADPPTGRVPEMKALQQTRRLLANARERTRVHTISAAFEALRKQVPCYSYGQKLSKLAILRIACNYILSLAQLAELDYGPEHSSLSFSQCVEQCTRTLQAEGRSKKRKE